jgi:hypothetical protein
MCKRKYADLFKRKYDALLISGNGDYIRRVTYTINGPKRFRVTLDGAAVLHDNGTLSGSRSFVRWEQL